MEVLFNENSFRLIAKEIEKESQDEKGYYVTPGVRHEIQKKFRFRWRTIKTYEAFSNKEAYNNKRKAITLYNLLIK